MFGVQRQCLAIAICSQAELSSYVGPVGLSEEGFRILYLRSLRAPGRAATEFVALAATAWTRVVSFRIHLNRLRKRAEGIGCMRILAG